MDESDPELAVRFTSNDGAADVDVRVTVTNSLSDSALFADLADASAFFQQGSVGYSATRQPSRFDGLELVTDAWPIDPASVVHARSSYFEDTTSFPTGSAVLDSSLVMRRVPVRWRAQPQLRASEQEAVHAP